VLIQLSKSEGAAAAELPAPMLESIDHKKASSEKKTAREHSCPDPISNTVVCFVSACKRTRSGKEYGKVSAEKIPQSSPIEDLQDKNGIEAKMGSLGSLDRSLLKHMLMMQNHLPHGEHSDLEGGGWKFV